MHMFRNSLVTSMTVFLLISPAFGKGHGADKHGLGDSHGMGQTWERGEGGGKPHKMNKGGWSDGCDVNGHGNGGWNKGRGKHGQAMSDIGRGDGCDENWRGMGNGRQSMGCDDHGQEMSNGGLGNVGKGCGLQGGIQRWNAGGSAGAWNQMNNSAQGICAAQQAFGRGHGNGLGGRKGGRGRGHKRGHGNVGVGYFPGGGATLGIFPGKGATNGIFPGKGNGVN